MDITLKWYLRPETPYITPALIAHPIFSDKCKMECSRKSGYAFFDKKLTEKLTFINTDFDYIIQHKNYKFRLTCTNLDNNTTIFTSFFTIKDCTVNYDDSIITVTPEIDTPESTILKNWDKEYKLTEIGAEIAAGDTTFYPVYQFYMAGDDTVYNVNHNMIVFPQSASSTVSNEVFTKYCWQPQAIFLSVEWLNMGANVGGDFAGILKRGNGLRYDGYLFDIHNQNNYITFHAELALQDDDIVFNFNFLQTVLFNGVTYTFDCKTKKYDTDDLNSYGVVNIADDSQQWCYLAKGGLVMMRLVTAKNAETDSDLTPLLQGDIVDNSNFVSVVNINYFKPQNHVFEFLTGFNTTTTPNEYYSKELNAYFTKPVTAFAPIFQSVWGFTSFWLQSSYFDRFTFFQKSISISDNYKLTSVIEKLTQKADNTINAFSFDSTINSLYLSHITNYKKINYTVAATAGTITLKKILDFLQDVLKMFWFVDNSELKIYSYGYFVDGYFYQNSWNLRQLTNLQNDQKIDLGQNTVTYRNTDNPVAIDFEFPNTPIHPDWTDYKTITFNSVLCSESERQTVNIFADTDLEGIIYNPTAFNDDGFVLLEIVNGFISLPRLSLKNIQHIWFGFDCVDSYKLEDNTNVIILEKYKKHIREQTIKFNIKDFDFDTQKFNGIVTSAGVSIIETVKFAFYENPCSLEITAVL